MKKVFCIIAFLINFTIILWAQNPLGNRGQEWNEQDGYAIVNGNNYHYWLYSTEFFSKYHNYNYNIIGKTTNDRLNLLHSSLLQWVEKQGWTIDYDNIHLFDPNNNLALSVKRLMALRGQDFGILNTNSIYMDVSVTVIIQDTKNATLTINYWNFMKEDYYKTWVYPLLKF